MKLAGLFDTETGYAGDEIVMELVALLDRVTRVTFDEISWVV